VRIAVVCVDDLSVVLFCQGLIKALRSNEDNHTCVISDTHDDDDGDGHYTDLIKSWGVVHISVPCYRYVSPLQDLKYTYSLYRIFRRERIDVVINVLNKPSIYGSIAATLASVNTRVTMLFGLGMVFSEQDDMRSRILRAIVRSLYRLAFRLSDHVWLTNESDCEYLRTRCALQQDKVILTKFWVDTHFYSATAVAPEALTRLRTELSLSSEHKVVIMVARMSWSKGIAEFVDAAKIVGQRLPSVQFILVGPKDEGSSDSVPDSYFAENETLANFRWLGFRRDVRELYALSHLAVLPSYYHEGGYPRALTEPMAMGMPIITTDNVHCRSTVDEGLNGYLIPIRDPVALATAIERLIVDDERLGQFGEHSRTKAEREFNEELIVTRTLRAVGLLGQETAEPTSSRAKNETVR